MSVSSLWSRLELEMQLKSSAEQTQPIRKVVDYIDPFNKTQWQRNIQQERQPSWTIDATNLSDHPTLINKIKNEDSYKSKTKLFVDKLKTCSIIYDFMENTNLENKMCKKQIMSEILEYLIHGQNVLTPELYRKIVDTVSKNIFRKLPSSEIKYDVEEDHNFYDPSWPHLLLSYEILTEFLNLPDFKTSLARYYINENFIDQFMDLFLSRDARERVTLQKILLKIYRAFILLRPYIRNRFYDCCWRYTFDEVYVIGLPDLMQFYSNIIPGFVLPLEAEHEKFFTNIFLLLHCGTMYPHYYKGYLDCIYEFLLKNPKLYEKVVDVIIRYWPKTCSTKQLLFLKELNDLLTDIKSEEFEIICIDLFTLLADCFSKPNYYVFDGALDVLNNPTICSHIKSYTDTIYPILIPVLLKSIEATYMPNGMKVQQVVNKFRNDSEKDFLFALRKYEDQARKNTIKEDFWKLVEDIAKKKQHLIKPVKSQNKITLDEDENISIIEVNEENQIDLFPYDVMLNLDMETVQNIKPKRIKDQSLFSQGRSIFVSDLVTENEDIEEDGLFLENFSLDDIKSGDGDEEEEDEKESSFISLESEVSACDEKSVFFRSGCLET